MQHALEDMRVPSLRELEFKFQSTASLDYFFSIVNLDDVLQLAQFSQLEEVVIAFPGSPYIPEGVQDAAADAAIVIASSRMGETRKRGLLRWR